MEPMRIIFDSELKLENVLIDIYTERKHRVEFAVVCIVCGISLGKYNNQ